ncbi:DUF1671-domain-containing protein [Pleomassaria siparia CBS 279.74]|uniref:DUF1671-domain-containing protein n=1 Tax=Pleomassaria siparia CBS 279.74 TaxID=1314801 RepID=A0A6G1KRQ0_9PLEO|nr:DUF1671-domain-containing protein [Pleomassaria siparia CBS 279.74]
MSSSMDLLTCPMCEFVAHPIDQYVMVLHFEQFHTKDSPFRIVDDTEVLPPRLPPRSCASKRTKHVDDSEFEEGSETEPLPRLPPRPSFKAPKLKSNSPPSEREEGDYVLCPEDDCGELVLLTNFDEHLDYHAQETLSFDESTGKYHTHSSASMHSLHNSNTSTTTYNSSSLEHNFNAALPDARRRNDGSGPKPKKNATRGRGESSGSEKSTLPRSMANFIGLTRSGKRVKPPGSKGRLGKDELGPYHDEERMPKWLYDQLDDGPKITVVNRIGRDGRLIKQETVENETPGIIPILAQLSALDRTVKEAYYCHPSTLHIGKMKKEGGFCGYRNIQMLVSYIQGARAQGSEEFSGRTPGVLKLQDMIERAWDKGINDIGRIQTGGIRGTRKYIGTPEAQALFLSTQIDCAVEMFSETANGQYEAHENLLHGIERYFRQAAVKTDGSNVYKTHLPPIYLQQPGHSITIIGFERRKDGSSILMIFDPTHKTSPAMHRLIGRKNIKTSRPEVLWPYRRAAKQLQRHAAFEVLMLTAHPPMVPVWDMLRQFPDCRFLYVFFRSRTLGYDVYPEDHFLRNFPWQQYGGLWIVDDARFAISDKMNPLTAQALRRITGEGSTSPTSSFSSSNESFTGKSFQPHSPTSMRGFDSCVSSRKTSFMSSFDGSQSIGGAFGIPAHEDMYSSVLKMYGLHMAPSHSDVGKLQPNPLSLMTELGRRFPGYPSPLSPTGDAKTWYPSPISECGTGVITPQAASPTPQFGSPMSMDGSEMCGPSRRCASHGYEMFFNQCDPNLSRTGTSRPIGAPPLSSCSVVSDNRGDPYCPPDCVATRSPSVNSISPMSPPRTVSPRTAMLKNMVGKQAFQTMGHNSTILSPDAQRHIPSSFTNPDSAISRTEGVHDINASLQPLSLSPISIHITNGTETETLTPVSPSGTDTMLSYTSNRTVENGLLAVRPLSEAQVAEYRFWCPCGRRACAFGCGEGSEGECSAAKRLFREEEEVKPEEPEHWIGDDDEGENYEP